MRTPAKTLLSLATAGVLATSLAACGSSGNSNASSGGQNTTAASAPASPVASIDNLTGVSTAVKLDANFVSALQSLKLTPAPVGTAKFDASTGTITFPITGGSATYYKPGSRTPYVESNIMHDGSGLSLTAGDKKVELTNFVVDAGTSKLMGDVSLNGTSVVKGAYLFFLDGRTLNPLQVNKSEGTAVLQGTTVKVSPTAAQLLNKTFGTDAVKDYLPVGVATITLKLPTS